MTGERTPWNPDKAWADPLIALLLLLCLSASTFVLRVRARAVARTPAQVGLQGRWVDMALGAQVTLGTPLRSLPQPETLVNPWDRAVAAILLAEAKALEPARAMADRAPQDPAFRAAFAAAYLEGRSQSLDPAVKRGLGPTLAGGLLEARLAPEPQRLQARKAALDGAQSRLVGFLTGALLGIFLAVGGLVYALLLGFAWPKQVPEAPRFPMPGRAVALVLLGWFTGFFLLNTLVSALLGSRAWSLPLGYLLQAAWGLFLIRAATGEDLGALRRRLFPGRWRSILPHVVGAWGLALAAVLLVGLLMGPWLRGKASPQEELLDGLRAAQGGAALALFLTVAVVAPCFEELMMRGFLLGHLRTRWTAFPALLATSLVFGFIHLQPLALPTLATLGGVLGLLVLRTGDLRGAIVLHGLWNGSVFLLIRAFG